MWTTTTTRSGVVTTTTTTTTRWRRRARVAAGARAWTTPMTTTTTGRGHASQRGEHDHQSRRHGRERGREMKTTMVGRPRSRVGAMCGVDEFAWCATTVYTLACVAGCKVAATPSWGEASAWASARVASLWMFVPVCALYAFLLYRSWTPDTLSLMMPGSLSEGLATGRVQFVPTLTSIMTLLSARATATSAWAHLLCVNIFVARHVALKTRERVLNDGFAPPIAHTLALATLAGPLGLLSYVFTAACYDFCRAALFADVEAASP